jgi:hypothetical protein
MEQAIERGVFPSSKDREHQEERKREEAHQILFLNVSPSIEKSAHVKLISNRTGLMNLRRPLGFPRRGFGPKLLHL